MSHSEIAGSKLAHSSPTLIAACHVLHRLYMPRHSPDALTSRLRVHTTNDSTGEALHQLLRCGDLTQPDNHLCTTKLALARSENPLKPNHVATASIKKPIHNVKERRDLRLVSAGKPAKPFSSSLECAAGAKFTPFLTAWHRSNWWSLSGSNR